MKKYILSTRGIVSLIALLVFLSVLVLILILHHYISQVNDEIQTYCDASADNYIVEMQGKIDSYLSVMEMIALNPQIRASIFRWDVSRQQMVELSLELDKTIDSLTFFLNEQSAVQRHTIYSYLPADGRHFTDIGQAFSQKWFEDIQDKQFVSSYTYSSYTHSTHLSLVSKIGSFRQTGGAGTCYQVITLDMDRVFRTSVAAFSGMEPYIFIFSDETGELLNSTQPALSEHAKQWIHGVTQDTLTKGDLLLTRKLSKLNLTALLLYPASDIAQLGSNTGLTMFVSIAALFVLLSFFILLFYRSYAAKLSRLTKRMDSFDEKEPVPLPDDVKSNDEIATINRHLYEMQSRIHTLIQQEYMAQMRLVNAQQEALMACINPHFLYNTLSSISAMASMEGANRSVDMIQALGGMFRYSSDISQRLVPLEKEIVNIRDYLYIQEQRLQDTFEYDISVEEGLEQLTVPKLFLQPIVENCFKHGFRTIKGQRSRKDDIKRLSITAKREEDGVTVTVRDNGTGFSDEEKAQLADILADGRNKEENGMKMGVYNVHKRLLLTYGPEYGISIDSVYEEYASVRIRIGLAPIQLDVR